MPGRQVWGWRVNVPISAAEVVAMLSKANPHILQQAKKEPAKQPKAAKRDPNGEARDRQSQTVRLAVDVPIWMVDHINATVQAKGYRSVQALIRIAIAKECGIKWKERAMGSFTPDTVKLMHRIQAMRKGGATLTKIAAHFGISRPYASVLSRSKPEGGWRGE
jgi:hypothetical protein